MYGAMDGGWVSLADDGTVVVTDVNRRVWRSSGMAGWVQLPIPQAAEQREVAAAREPGLDAARAFGDAIGAVV